MITRNIFTFLLTGLLVLSVAGPTLGDGNDGTPGELQRAGLVKQWSSHIQVDSARAHVVDLHLHVNSSKAQTRYEVYVGDRLREVISTTSRDASGRVLGNQRASEKADLRKEVIEHEVAASLAPKTLTSDEYDELVFGTSEEQIQKRREMLDEKRQAVTVKKSVVPVSTLYAITSHSVIHAIDAETGKTRWVKQIGRRDFPTMHVSASDHLVAAVNGSSIYCLSAKDGSILWRRSCESLPGAGPSVSYNYVFVPLISGKVQAFPIRSKGLDPKYFVSAGRALTQPLITARTISWPTDRGHYNVAYYDEAVTHREVGAIKYRLKLDDEIIAVAARSSRVLFVPSTNGYLYAMDEVLGTIYWEYSAGEPISQSPVVIGDWIYLVTDRDNLFKIGVRDGVPAPEWPEGVAGIRQIVSVSSDRIYAIDTNQNLVALQIETGNRVAKVHVGNSDIRLFNNRTDRIFVGDKKGRIRCWREVKQLHPVVHGDAPRETKGEEGNSEPKPLIDKPVDPDTNPFETEEELAQDPFTVADPEPVNPFDLEGSSEGESDPSEDEDEGDLFGG